jgi:glyoxylase-like metal-dependent hydrolase (beta-lactamase superfamily II)
MRPIESSLADIGVQGKDFDEVILTHAHYDHIGGIKAFPNARFCIQQRELFEWLKVLALPKEYDYLLAAIDPADIRNLVDLLLQKRLTLVEGEVADYLPGISLFPVFDSHTYGLQLVRIRDGSDDWVFTSDACLSFENLGQEGDFGPYFPVGFAVGNLTLMMKALDRIRVLSRNRLDRILMTHEGEMWNRFPSKVTSGGMHVAEICLASGKHSKL